MEWREEGITDAAAAKARFGIQGPPFHNSLVHLHRPQEIHPSGAELWTRIERGFVRAKLEQSSHSCFNLAGEDLSKLTVIRSERERAKVQDEFINQVRAYGWISMDIESSISSLGGNRKTLLLLGSPRPWGLVIVLSFFGHSVREGLGDTFRRLLASRRIATVGVNIHQDCTAVEIGRPIDVRGLYAEWQDTGFSEFRAPSFLQRRFGLKDIAFALFGEAHSVFFPGKKIKKDLEKHYSSYGETVPLPLQDSRNMLSVYSDFSSQSLPSFVLRYTARDLFSATAVINIEMLRFLADNASPEQTFVKSQVVEAVLQKAESLPIPAVVQPSHPWRFFKPGEGEVYDSDNTINDCGDMDKQPEDEDTKSIQKDLKEEEARSRALESEVERLRRLLAEKEESIEQIEQKAHMASAQLVHASPAHRQSSPSPPQKASRASEEGESETTGPDWTAEASTSTASVGPALRRRLSRFGPWDRPPFSRFCGICGRHPPTEPCRIPAEKRVICTYTPGCTEDGTHSMEFCPILQGVCTNCGFRGHCGAGIDCGSYDVKEEWKRKFYRFKNRGAATRNDDRDSRWAYEPRSN